MEVTLLSRIQFGLNIGFHYIYPPLSIGLSLMLVIFGAIYLATKKPEHKAIYRFWVKIFALIFALGVATGIVMVFAFGTNWARYSRFVGSVFGSALGAEGIFAFFLEAGFLGVLLFGWDKVKPWFHYMAMVFVAFGAHFSALWIVIANSWMQTPAGYKLVHVGGETRAVVTHFWQMLFNPSVLDRVSHVIVGCWLTGVFLVISVSAYYMLKKRHLEFAKTTMHVGLVVAALTLALQLLTADASARGVAFHQPSKFAAMEGIYKTRKAAPLNLIGWVDEKTEKVHTLNIPGLLSYLTYGTIEKPIKGFDQIPPDERPPIHVTFQCYHIMIWMWGFMCLATTAGIFFWWRGTLARSKLTLLGLVFSALFPHIANQAGWLTAEVGRQPWVVYGLLRTSEGVSTTISAHQVIYSIVMFGLMYSALFALFIFLLNRKIQHGPEEEAPDLAAVYREPSLHMKGGGNR